MEMTPVTSSNIQAVGYDNPSMTLSVQFHHGGIYDYLDVPSEIYFSMISAESVGKYFDQHVKKAGYRFSKR